MCDDWWDPLDATVVCTQLGFSPTGLFYHLWMSPLIRSTSLPLTGSLPVVHSDLGSPPNRSIFLDNVVCTGGEGNLTECGYTTISNCDSSEEAGVRCEGIKNSYHPAMKLPEENVFVYSKMSGR